MLLLICLAVLASAFAPLAQAHATAIRRNNGSPGCGIEHSFTGESEEFAFDSSGGSRTYRIHLPSDYDIDSPQPLLIAYHGSGGNPAAFEDETGFSNETVNPGMITVYPAGVDGNWQGPTYATADVSDKIFTTDLVKRIKDNYCIDESRVYAFGHSNGGGFVGTLACSPGHGGQFAAFAASSAALYTDVTGEETCSPARSPLPIMEAHGTSDPIIPYEGGNGRGGPLPAIPEWLSRWVTRNRGRSPCQTTDLGNGVTEEKWTNASGKIVVRHIKVDGHGHDFLAQGTSQIYISPLVVEFLTQFSH